MVTVTVKEERTNVKCAVATESTEHVSIQLQKWLLDGGVQLDNSSASLTGTCAMVTVTVKEERTKVKCVHLISKWITNLDIVNL